MISYNQTLPKSKRVISPKQRDALARGKENLQKKIFEQKLNPPQYNQLSQPTNYPQLENSVAMIAQGPPVPLNTNT